MGKGQRRIQTQQEQISREQNQIGKEAQKRLIDGSPEFQARKARVASRRKAIESGTISDQKDFVSNREAVAERARQYETKQNLLKTGIAGLAANYANPTQVALAKQMATDEFARDSAAQTSADAKQYIAETDAAETDIINAQIGVDSGIMGQAFGTSQQSIQLASQIAAQRASVLPSILGMAIGAGAQIATGSGWFTRGAKAATGG